MLTLFTIPKPFDGHIGVIQHNAIRSWTKLRAEVEILLCGEERGCAEVARELGLVVLPEVARNRYGTPLVSAAFHLARRHARHPLLCYVNCDILLLPDFPEALTSIERDDFVLSGRHRSLSITEPLDFGPGWARRLRREARLFGILEDPRSRDYFVLPRSSAVIDGFPDFAVGRPYWDAWICQHTLELGLPLIDATPAILAIHQRHGYGHVPLAEGARWDGPEARDNHRLIGSQSPETLNTLLDADHVLRGERLRRLPKALMLARKLLGRLEDLARNSWLHGARSARARAGVRQLLRASVGLSSRLGVGQRLATKALDSWDRLDPQR